MHFRLDPDVSTIPLLQEVWYGEIADTRGTFLIGPWETLECDDFFDKVFWLAFSLYGLCCHSRKVATRAQSETYGCMLVKNSRVIYGSQLLL